MGEMEVEEEGGRGGERTREGAIKDVGREESREVKSGNFFRDRFRLINVRPTVPTSPPSSLFNSSTFSSSYVFDSSFASSCLFSADIVVFLRDEPMTLEVEEEVIDAARLDRDLTTSHFEFEVEGARRDEVEGVGEMEDEEGRLGRGRLGNKLGDFSFKQY